MMSADSLKNPQVEEAWRKEIRRRLIEINTDKVKMIPWEEARRLPRDRLSGTGTLSD